MSNKVTESSDDIEYVDDLKPGECECGAPHNLNYNYFSEYKFSDDELDCQTDDLKPGECDCGAMRAVHMREVPGCEYHEHHCDMCHEREICTAKECKL